MISVSGCTKILNRIGKKMGKTQESPKEQPLQNNTSSHFVLLRRRRRMPTPKATERAKRLKKATNLSYLWMEMVHKENLKQFPVKTLD